MPEHKELSECSWLPEMIICNSSHAVHVAGSGLLFWDCGLGAVFVCRTHQCYGFPHQLPTEMLNNFPVSALVCSIVLFNWLLDDKPDFRINLGIQIQLI